MATETQAIPRAIDPARWWTSDSAAVHELEGMIYGFYSCLWKLIAAFWLQEPRLIQLFDEKRQRHGFCWDSEDRRSMDGDAGNVIQKQEFPYHNEGLWIQPPKEVWPRLAKYLGLFEDCFFPSSKWLISFFLSTIYISFTHSHCPGHTTAAKVWVGLWALKRAEAGHPEWKMWPPVARMA